MKTRPFLSALFYILLSLTANFPVFVHAQHASSAPSFSLSSNSLPSSDSVFSSPISDTDQNIVRAALKGWSLFIGADFLVGGAAPFPLPREIRAIKSYNPLLNLSLNGEAMRRFKGTAWSIVLGARLESKGMQTKARVKNYHMEITAPDGGYMEGRFTGDATTRMKNTYLTLSLSAARQISRRMTLTGGPWFSFLLDGNFTGYASNGYIRRHDPTGEKAYIDHATYDFSNKLSKTSWGITLGASYRAYRHFNLTGGISWGVSSIFPKDFHGITFRMRPIFSRLGFQYRF